MSVLSRMVIPLCAVLIGWAAVINLARAQQEFILGGFDPSEWTVGNQVKDRNQIVTEFVRPGEKIDSWTELFTAQILRKSSVSEPMDDLVKKIHLETSRQCPTMTWNVIARQIPGDSGEDGMLYEWTIRNCPPEADQHEVTRIVYGRFNIFRLAYTAKTQALDPGKREKWIKDLSAAKVVRK